MSLIVDRSQTEPCHICDTPTNTYLLEEVDFDPITTRVVPMPYCGCEEEPTKADCGHTVHPFNLVPIYEGHVFICTECYNATDESPNDDV